MDEYVTVEAYDVMLGSNTYSAGGSDPNRASDATGSATAHWNLDTGVTGKGWDLL